jgi:hypothetical protein
MQSYARFCYIKMGCFQSSLASMFPVIGVLTSQCVRSHRLRTAWEPNTGMPSHDKPPPRACSRTNMSWTQNSRTQQAPQTIAAGYALLTVAAGCLYARTTRASFLCITMPLDCKRSAHTECKFVLTSKTSYGMIWARHVKTHNTLNEGSSYYQFKICTECICSLHEISHENSLHSEHTE